MKRRRFHSLVFMMVLAGLTFGVVPTSLGGQAAQDPKSIHPGQGLENGAQVEAFFDGLLAGQLQAYSIAGAAVAVVREGKVLLAKGYGLADAAQRTPVRADTTLFRMASISKLFTWTSVMQLVEQGRLDLRRDVNSYLEAFRIPDTYPQPITLEHLMTHTAGFEDLVMGIGAFRAEDVLSLEKSLKTRMPRRVRPPGLVTAYSNYSTALAGYIVQRIVGRPFEEYVEEAIFKPLGMERSSFRQPPPGVLAEDVSRGHLVRDGLFLPQGFEFVNGIAPAGALSSTVTDMARFMIAHLEGGAYGGARILARETTAAMHSRLFSNAPGVNGNAHGFWERRSNGLRLIGHGGDTWFFHSQLILIPEERTGLLVVYNTQTAASPARDEVLQAFLDEFYPVPRAVPPEILASSPQSLKKYAGWYGLSRAASSNLEKAMGLMLTIRVSVTDKGILRVQWPAGLGSRLWVEVEPGVFQRADGRDKIVFRADDHGRVTYALLDSLPLMAGVRLRGLEVPYYHWALMGFCLLVFIAVFTWPLSWLIKRICRPSPMEKRVPWPAEASLFMASLLYLAFFVLLVMSLLKPEEFLLGIPAPLRVGLWLPLASIPFLAAALIFSVLSWLKKYWTTCGRLFYSLATLAGIAFLLDLAYWNALGFPHG